MNMHFNSKIVYYYYTIFFEILSTFDATATNALKNINCDFNIFLIFIKSNLWGSSFQNFKSLWIFFSKLQRNKTENL